jgi:hypothetical protein
MKTSTVLLLAGGAFLLYYLYTQSQNSSSAATTPLVGRRNLGGDLNNAVAAAGSGIAGAAIQGAGNELSSLFNAPSNSSGVTMPTEEYGTGGTMAETDASS